MVLLVFLVDTSASMNMRTCLGTTYLDVAKGAVESFLKIRSRDANVCRGDRYMLVTFDDSTKSVKAGWRENLPVFMRELKNLQAHGLSNLNLALKATFDLLNMHRLQSGFDNYGLGYNPFYLEPALVLLFSDGCSQMDFNGIIPEICIPIHDSLPGSELTKEPYRWDQRLFCLNLKIPGYASCITEKTGVMEAEDKLLSNLCDQTGGKLYNIGTHKSLMQSMESIAQKIMVPGVIIQFEKYGDDPEPLLTENNSTNGTVKEEPQLKKDESVTPLAEKKINEQLPNGFIPKFPPPTDIPTLPPPTEMNGDIQKEYFSNGFMDNDEQARNGLLPTPMLPPNMPPRMFPPPPFLRGLLPTPPPLPGGIPQHGFLPPPPAPPFLNQVMANNSENQMPNMPHIKMNGKVDDKDAIASVNIKTEGQFPSPVPVLENPIRGDFVAKASQGATRGDIASPNVPPNTSNAWHSQKRMIFVRSNIKGTVGHWPIPESFWPESTMVKLPPRDCHPIVRFQCKACEAMVIDHMPFDKYELEPSPLTQYILERKQPYAAWQTFISGSSLDGEIGYPFGYLKAATNLQCVNLFILPYNYPVIMPLLDELFKIHKCKPTVRWRESFDEYLQKLPSYYIVPLRNALRRMGAPNNLIPEHMDGSLSYAVATYLKKVKQQAKIEAERLINFHSQPYIPPAVHVTLPLAPQLNDGKTKDFKDLLIQKDAKALNDSYARRIRSNKNRSKDEKRSITKRLIPPPSEKFQVRSYKNPFDIRRGDLINQVDRMRANFYHSTILGCKIRDEDSIHHISISQMGKYEDVANQIKRLRELDQTQVRVHTFGNPFKLKQDQNVIFAVDEADVSDNLALNNQKNRKRPGETTSPYKGVKRKRSETPPSRRPLGPPNTPPPTPLSSPSSNIPSMNNSDTENKLKLNTKPEVKLEVDEKLSRKETGKNSASVNQQLRKLQLLHRNKKTTTTSNNNNTDRLITSIPNEKSDNDSSSVVDSSSPILSILRTSLEDIVDDNENEELTNINNQSSKTILTKKSNSRPPSIVTVTSPPLKPIKFEDLPPDRIRKARKELSKRSVIRARLNIWRAIRAKEGLPAIKTSIDQLNLTDDSKYIFVCNVIDEIERFEDNRLADNLKPYLPKLYCTAR